MTLLLVPIIETEVDKTDICFLRHFLRFREVLPIILFLVAVKASDFEQIFESPARVI